jgi:YVTN family beta-propeller protein
MVEHFPVESGAMSGKRIMAAMFLLICVALEYGQTSSPLRLVRTIPMPDVQGRIDHMFLDPQSGRLFVAALGNNTVEIIDTAAGKRIHSITGLHEPQGILYLSGPNRLYVANGDDGTLRIFDGSTYQPLATIKLGDDADNIRWDDEKHRIYIGYGSGALAAVDEKGSKLDEVRLDAHPESFRIEPKGTRLFVNLPESRKIAVIDNQTKSVIGNWRTDDASENFPMTLDEADRRLFVVCRRPARLLALDTDSGRVVGSWPVVGDCDDVFWDPTMKRLYATGGEGAISVFQQQTANNYERVANVATRKGARTSFFSSERHALYVAARRQGSETAAILVYNAQH